MYPGSRLSAYSALVITSSGVVSAPLLAGEAEAPSAGAPLDSGRKAAPARAEPSARADGSVHAGALEGIVRSSEAHQPVRGVQIQLQGGPAGSHIYRTFTDDQGRFRIEGLPAGVWQLRSSHPNFATVERRVTVEANGLSVELELSARSVPVAEVIEVSDRAVARATPAAFANLSRQDLEERGTIKDLPMLLADTPSITSYSENGNGIGYNHLTLRGFDQRRVSVMIDGVPQNDPEDHDVYWLNVFDLTGSLQDVQVQRGGGAGFYGPPAIGGTINLVTRQFSSEPYTQFDAGYGSFNSYRLSAEANTGLLGNHWVGYLRLSALGSDGYRDWSWTRFMRGFAGLSWYGEKSTVRLQAYGGPQDDALAYYGIPKEYNSDPVLRKSNYSDGIDIEHFNQTHVDLIHDWQITSGLALHQVFFYQRGAGFFDFDGSWGDATYFRLCSNDPDTGAALGDYPQYCVDPADPASQIPGDTLIRAYVGIHQFGWLPRFTLKHGNSGELNVGAELRASRTLHWGRIQAGEGYPDAVVGDADRHYYQYRGAKDILSPYVNERVRLGRFDLEGNLQVVAQRYRIYDEAFVGTDFTEPYLFVNPRLGVNFNATGNLNAYGSVSQTSREPRLKNLYDADSASYGYAPAFVESSASLNLAGVFTNVYGRPAVKFETLNDLELGLHYQIPRFQATLSGFYMDFQNEIVNTGGLDQFGVPNTGNAARTRHMGLELSGAVRVVEGLDLTANATLSQNRFVEFDEYLDGQAAAISRAGKPISGFPDALGNVRLSYRRGGGMVSLDARMVGRQYVDNSGDTNDDGTSAGGARTVDPYALLGATAVYRLPASWPVAGLSIGAELNNILNSKVLLAGYYDSYGAAFFPAPPRNFFVWARYERPLKRNSRQ